MLGLVTLASSHGTSCLILFNAILSLTILILPVVSQPFSNVSGPFRNCSTTADAFNFIIVGGGTAGLALASRLSKNFPQKCILVIEAGPNGQYDPDIYIPGRRGSTFGSVYDWNFTTVPQPGANNRKLPQTRGKILGGSSAINFMSWDRAGMAEYDAWEDLGNPGWNFNNMFSAMLKAEHYHIGTGIGMYGVTGVGYGGPVQIVVNHWVPEQQKSFMPALDNLGIHEWIDSLGGNAVGSSYQPSSIRPSNWTRSYSTEYLPLAGGNLVLMLDTRVVKINFNNGNHELTATGVTLANGTIISAENEVILSAGTFQSPGLLELSGVGDPSILSRAGISPRLNMSGVGENLQDHIRIQNTYQLKQGYNSSDIFRYNSSYAEGQMSLYEAGNISHYDYTGSVYAFANWDMVQGAPAEELLNLAKRAAAAKNDSISAKKVEFLTDLDAKREVPQLEVIFSDGYTGAEGYPAKGAALYGENFFALIGAIEHPFSRGSVHIDPSEPLSQPIIDPNYLAHEYDVAAAVAATKYLRRLANTEPLKNVWTSEYEPGNDVQSDQEWTEFVKNNVLTIYHPVGTCAMLPREARGVVSPELKVYGTHNLRVVDASIIPLLISAHIQTAVYGIAERAAEMIVDDWDS
ncbi:hypothetical protein BDY21DRAFT_329737 [Lineolata rhizophorae]|uniref:Glucose-methanol-choline oxidoreductase N-terminal domain-containing protein n=1 Tax=Lineolata rhizophorae TaxID=578093 RepID=A0A6A6PDE6_9PEZI|nr:hypothetical protein BDY21DRAFT_329737 [Lineolata rhizophorae]